ncbi:MAG: tetratricopeptide repeat protein, partial [Planctomycetota bacterium]
MVLKLALTLSAMLLLRLGGEPPVPAGFAQLDPDTRRVIEHALAEVRRTPEQPRAWHELGLVYHAHQQLEPARTCYVRALELDDARAQVWYVHAALLHRTGKTREALTALERVIALEPTYPPAHWRLALWLLQEGRTDAADHAVLRALELAPADRHARLVRARVLLQRGEHATAATYLETLARDHPDDRYVQFLLGTAYRGL